MPGKVAAFLITLALIGASSGASLGAPAKPATVKSSGPLLFHGYACSGDCTSHQQGYSWASEHKISNPMECRGTSETFVEGCRAYAGIEGPLGEKQIFQDED